MPNLVRLRGYRPMPKYEALDNVRSILHQHDIGHGVGMGDHMQYLRALYEMHPDFKDKPFDRVLMIFRVSLGRRGARKLALYHIVEDKTQDFDYKKAIDAAAI